MLSLVLATLVGTLLRGASTTARLLGTSTVKINLFRIEEEILLLGPKLFRLFLMRLEKMNEIFTSGERNVEEMRGRRDRNEPCVPRKGGNLHQK